MRFNVKAMKHFIKIAKRNKLDFVVVSDRDGGFAGAFRQRLASLGGKLPELPAIGLRGKHGFRIDLAAMTSALPPEPKLAAEIEIVDAELEPGAEAGRLRVRSGNSETTVWFCPATEDDYFGVPTGTPEASWRGERLQAAIRGLAPVVAAGKARSYGLDCLLLDAEKGRAIATDGHRAHGETALLGSESILVPGWLVGTVPTTKESKVARLQIGANEYEDRCYAAFSAYSSAFVFGASFRPVSDFPAIDTVIDGVRNNVEWSLAHGAATELAAALANATGLALVTDNLVTVKDVDTRTTIGTEFNVAEERTRRAVTALNPALLREALLWLENDSYDAVEFETNWPLAANDGFERIAGPVWFEKLERWAIVMPFCDSEAETLRKEAAKDLVIDDEEAA